MPDTMPRTVAHRSDRGLVASATGAAIVAAAHFTGHVGWNASLMLYMALMAAAIVCGVSSALARCHMAIATAFSAGVKVGRAHESAPPRQPSRPGLRAVE